MDSRTITLIASIAVIGIVAIGAGYAYTAITVNDGNSAQAQYVTLTQEDYRFTAVNTTEQFDSATTSTSTGYKTTDVAGVSGYVLLSLGTEKITATSHGYTFSTTPAPLKLTIDSSSGFTPGTKLTYYLVVGTDIVAELTGEDTWTLKTVTNVSGTDGILITKKASDPQSGSYYNDLDLKLCYGYVNSDLTTIAGGSYVLEAPENLTSGTLVFKTVVS